MKSPFERLWSTFSASVRAEAGGGSDSAAKRARRAGGRRASDRQMRQVEQLESRAMLAVFAYDIPRTSMTLVAIDANRGLTDLYIRGTTGGNVQLATDPSFLGATTVDALDWVNGGINPNNYTRGSGQTLYITNATPNQNVVSETEANGFVATSTSKTTDFSLSNGNIAVETTTGTLTYGTSTWTFVADTFGRLTFTRTAGSGGPTPLDGVSIVRAGDTQPALRGAGLRGIISVQWSDAVSTYYSTSPVLTTAQYEYDRVAAAPTPTSVTDTALKAQETSVGPATTFALTNSSVDPKLVAGTVSLGPDSWTFVADATGTGRLTFAPVGTPAGTFTPLDNVSQLVPGAKGSTDSLRIQWSGNVDPSTASIPSVTYTYAKAAGGSTSFWIEDTVGVTTPNKVSFTVPTAVTKPSLSSSGDYTLTQNFADMRVPGTTTRSGVITVYDVTPTGSVGSATIPLSFSFSDASGSLVFTPMQNDWLEIAPGSTLGSISFINRYAGGKAPAESAAVSPGRVTFKMTETWFEYRDNLDGTNVVIRPGFDISNPISIDLTAGFDNSLQVLSPVLNSPSISALGASTVNFESPTSSLGGITLGGGLVKSTSDQSLFTPSLGYVSFDAATAANAYSVNIAGGAMLVSSTGSLSGALSPTTGNVSVPSGGILVNAIGADVFVEGTIYATRQQYELRGNYSGPRFFSTRSPKTDLNTGLVRGDTVVVLMGMQGGGNNAPSPANGDTSYQTVDLHTQVRSFRARANDTSRPTLPGSGMYPYNLTIDEVDDITFDAVAGSSRDISITAAGKINFTSALVTEGNVSIAATTPAGAASPNSFTVSAPIQTAYGTIAISAGSLSVNNTLAVISAPVDANATDITLTSTAGNLVMQNLVSAVNNVSLVQRGNGSNRGLLSGSLVNARNLSVSADGNVSLRTTVETVTARGGGDFSLAETDDVRIGSLRAPGRVSVSAGGVDPGSAGANAIALSGNLADVTSLEVAAPKGSIDLTVNTPKLLSLGGPTAAGLIANMQAAGSVKIRSTAGEVKAYDAPLAGGNAFTVRAASTAALAATYAPDVANVSAGILTGTGSINKPGLFDGVTNLAVGDRVLVAKGFTANGITSLAANGIYTVARVGGGAGINANYQLTRATDANSQAKLPAGSFVRIGEGTTLAGTYQQLTSATIAPAWAALSSANQIELPWASTSDNWGKLFVGQMVTGLPVNGAVVVYGTVVSWEAATGIVTLSANSVDMNAVAAGVESSQVSFSMAQSGLATLTAVNTLTMPWASNSPAWDKLFVGQAVTGTLLSRNASVITGIDRATGKISVKATDSAMPTGSTGTVTFAAGFGNEAFAATAVTPKTDIGSDAVSKAVTFVVSSTGGTNADAGSLGKMLLLRQQNDTSADSLNPEQTMNLAFAALSGPINLTQALPAITKPFDINGNGAVIDGSRIVTTRSGARAVAGSTIDGFEFLAGSSAAVKNGVLQGGGTLSNVTLAGFGSGAAVKLNSAAGIAIDRVTLGLDGNGNRLANQFGVLATGAGTSSGAVTNSTIVGSTAAGIRTENGAGGLRLVGDTIGTANANNVVGIQLASANGSNVGVDPIGPTSSLPLASVTLSKTSKNVTLPAGYAGLSSLFVGLGVSGTGIPAGTVITALNTTTRVLTLSNFPTVSAASSLTFANFVTTTTGGTTLVLPEAIALQNLYLGQSVAGKGIATNARIVAIDAPNRTITLSAAATATGTTPITFGGAPRNTVQANLTGIQLIAGSNVVTNTNIVGNTYNGIEITGGTQQVGTSKTLSAGSNQIYSNGGYGIYAATAVAAAQKIWGNYVGTNSAAKTSLLNTKGQISPALGPIDPKTGIDASGNQIGPAPASSSPPPSNPGTFAPPGGIRPR